MNALPPLVLAAALVLATSAQASVFRCTDAQGRVTYTNDRSLTRDCKPLSQDLPVSTVSSPRPSATPATPATRPPAATPGNFPQVTPETQRTRDEGRRQILQDELKREEAALEAAREKLREEEQRDAPEDRNARSDGRSTINQAKRQERLQPFENQIELHQRNITSLKQEISRTR